MCELWIQIPLYFGCLSLASLVWDIAHFGPVNQAMANGMGLAFQSDVGNVFPCNDGGFQK